MAPFDTDLIHHELQVWQTFAIEDVVWSVYLRLDCYYTNSSHTPKYRSNSTRYATESA